MKRISICTLILLSSVTMLLLSACGVSEPEAITLDTAALSSYTSSGPAVHMQLKTPGTNDIMCKIYNTPASTKPVVTGCPSGTYTEQLFGADWKQIGLNKTVTVGTPNPTPSPAVYSQTFDTVSLGKYKGISDLNVEACAGKGRCLKASYRPTSQGSPRLVYTEPLPAAKEYTLTYDLRFDKNFEWVYGGKLPGLAPSNVNAGCAARVDDAWSARLMWRDNGKFVQYLYHQDGSGCGEDVPATGFTLQKDRWYKVAVYVRVNSSASTKDGQVRLFVDGKEVARRDNLQLRNTSSGGLIEKFLFSSFYGGSDSKWSPPRTTYAYFDNFAVYPGLHTQ